MYTQAVVFVYFDACQHCITVCTVAATNCLVELKIPLGDRPPSEDLEKMEVEGLKELVDLMKRCWDANPDKRPPFNSMYLL